MKKHQSEAQKEISLHYFGVYPIQIQFVDKIPEDTRLYFEKDIQIIAKFPIPSNTQSQQKIVLFPRPEKIYHFRTFSDKNLQYQWSFYFGIQNEQIKDQLHLQSQKFGLGEWWKCFIQTRQSIFQLRMEFKTVKANLMYLLVVCKSSEDLIIKIKNHITTMNQKNKQEALLKNKIIEQENTFRYQKNIDLPKFPSSSSMKVITEARLSGSEEKKRQDEMQKQFSSLETGIRQRQQTQMSQLEELPYNQLRLSHSEMALSEAIQQDLRQSERQRLEPIVININTLSPPKQQHHVSIKRTRSEIVIDKYPSISLQFSKKKLIIAIVAILILIGFALGLYIYNGNSRQQLIVPHIQQNQPYISEQPEKKRKKARKTKKTK